MREAKIADNITAFDQNSDVANRAKTLGVVDAVADDFKSAVAGAELIILATPVGAITSLCVSLNEHAPSNAFVIDVGSVKGAVAQARTVITR